MKENILTQQLIIKLRRDLGTAVVIKHSDKITSGIPDMSVTHLGRTIWFEIKKIDNWPPSQIQDRMMRSLYRESNGLAHYVIFRSNKEFDLCAGDQSYRETVGYDRLLDLINMEGGMI